jgi:hypothetical protein
MNRKSALLVLGSVAAGLILGLVIRRARGPSPLDPVAARAALPSKERVRAALLRAEIRELDARMEALKDEQRRLDEDLQRLAFLAEPAPPPSIEEQILQDARLALDQWSFIGRPEIFEWLKSDPARIVTLARKVAQAYREKERGWLEARHAQDYVAMVARGLTFPEGSPEREKLQHMLASAQRTETDAVVRALLISAMDNWKLPLPPEEMAELGRAFQESHDRLFRDAAFGMILGDPASRDLVRETIRQNGDAEERTQQLLKAWERRGLPGNELRGLAREIMKSDAPGSMIMDAQEWVPKYINPLAPQETIALFNQTLSKPIDPFHKAISIMVMGSIATLFPGQPGRAEIETFLNATEDQRLKDFAGKIGGLIDEGKNYNDIRQMSPLQHGFELPKK